VITTFYPISESVLNLITNRTSSSLITISPIDRHRTQNLRILSYENFFQTETHQHVSSNSNVFQHTLPLLLQSHWFVTLCNFYLTSDFFRRYNVPVHFIVFTMHSSEQHYVPCYICERICSIITFQYSWRTSSNAGLQIKFHLSFRGLAYRTI